MYCHGQKPSRNGYIHYKLAFVNTAQTNGGGLCEQLNYHYSDSVIFAQLIRFITICHDYRAILSSPEPSASLGRQGLSWRSCPGHSSKPKQWAVWGRERERSEIQKLRITAGYTVSKILRTQQL